MNTLTIPAPKYAIGEAVTHCYGGEYAQQYTVLRRAFYLPESGIECGYWLYGIYANKGGIYGSYDYREAEIIPWRKGGAYVR